MTSSVDTRALIRQMAVPPPPNSPYAVPVPGSEREGRTAVYRHWRNRDGELMTTLDPAIRTMFDLFEESVKKYSKWPCLGYRPWNATTRTWEDKYTWITYGEVAERRKNLGAGLVEIHEQLGIGRDRYGVGLWSQNRPEWHITGIYFFYIWSSSSL